jgi:hypothetical protein
LKYAPVPYWLCIASTEHPSFPILPFVFFFNKLKKTSEPASKTSTDKKYPVKKKSENVTKIYRKNVEPDFANVLFERQGQRDI